MHFVTAMTIACERSVSGGENGAERAENRVERSGERLLQKNDEAEWSAEREVAEQAVRKMGCSFFAAHAPLTCSGNNITQSTVHLD